MSKLGQRSTLARYLDAVGLEAGGTDECRSAVEDALEADPGDLDADTAASLFRYPVVEGGEGAEGESLRDEPYDLAAACGVDDPGPDHPDTVRLWRLNRVAESLADEVGADWLGVFRCTEHGGERVLVKEAYVGDHGRAEYPLTLDEAEGSNGVLAALTGEAVLVENVEEHQGPYYERDARMRSELYCPVFEPGDPGGEVAGVVGAESFHAGFFADDDRVRAVARACAELGEAGLLTAAAG